MAITLTLTSNITNNEIAQVDLPQLVNLSATAVDSTSPSALFNFSWYILDYPTTSSAILSSAGGASTSFTADEWGTYRIFCIAENQATGVTSNTNPFSAPLSSFLDISVKSEKYELEKPAKSQRNWQEKYWHLVETVENLSTDSATYLTSGISQIATPGKIATAANPTLSASGEDYLILSANAFYDSLLPTANGAVATSNDNLMRVRLKEIALEQINESSIDELLDVDTTTTSPSDGDVLTWNDTDGVWIPVAPTGGGGGAENLDDLLDVDVPSPSDGQYLRWNNTNSQWEAQDADPVIVGISLDNILDVDAPTPSNKDVLKYNSGTSNWENGTLSINDLNNVNAIAAIEGDFLVYNSGEWTNQSIDVPETFNDLTNVNVSGALNTQIVQYNGAEWVNIDHTLNNLTDVVITTPSTNEVLVYNGTNWVNDTVSSGATTLNDLTDVSVSAVADNQFLRYDSGSAQWVNESVTIPTNLDSLSDVTITAASNRQVLKYNGSFFTNGAAVDGLSSDASTTLTVSSGYKILPFVTGQDLGSTSARWDLFAQSGNFSTNVTITGAAVFQDGARIDDNGAGNLLLTGAGGGDLGGGEIFLATDSLYLQPTQIASPTNPTMTYENENGNTFTLGPQGKTVVNSGFQFPSIVGSAGQYLKIDSVTGNIMAIEPATITTEKTYHAYIDTNLNSSAFPLLTFNGTTEGSTVTAGLPSFANGVICCWKNTSGHTIQLNKVSAMCMQQRSLSNGFALVRATSDANMRDGNYAHIGTQFNVINNSGVSNTLGTGLGSATMTYNLANGYWIAIVKIATDNHTDTQTQFQLTYTDSL